MCFLRLSVCLACCTGDSSLRKEKSTGPWQQMSSASQAIAGMYVEEIHKNLNCQRKASKVLTECFEL